MLLTQVVAEIDMIPTWTITKKIAVFRLGAEIIIIVVMKVQ